MRDLNRRLDGLEATLALEGKPFIIWAMIDRRRMTNLELDATFQEAIASGRAKSDDRPLAISWMSRKASIQIPRRECPGIHRAMLCVTTAPFSRVLNQPGPVS